MIDSDRRSMILMTMSVELQELHTEQVDELLTLEDTPKTDEAMLYYRWLLRWFSTASGNAVTVVDRMLADSSVQPDELFKRLRMMNTRAGGLDVMLHKMMRQLLGSVVADDDVEMYVRRGLWMSRILTMAYDLVLDDFAPRA